MAAVTSCEHTLFSWTVQSRDPDASGFRYSHWVKVILEYAQQTDLYERGLYNVHGKATPINKRTIHFEKF